jgi:hypothetical protein
MQQMMDAADDGVQSGLVSKTNWPMPAKIIFLICKCA